MKLKHVEKMAFSQGEHTMYKKLCDTYPHLSVLSKNDVILVISLTGNQLVFIHGFTSVDGLNALHSERLRLPNHRPWNPTMLVNYAEQVGITLEGLRRFEDILRKGA